MRKVCGKETSNSRLQMSGIRERSCTAEGQGFEMRRISLPGISRKDGVLGSDLFQTVDR